MADPMTESFENEDDRSGEWDQHDDDPGPQILWGRVAALAAIVILAFLIGRASAGAGVPERELKKAQREAAALETENQDLRSQVALLDAGSLAPDAAPAELDGTVALPPEGSTEATGEGVAENDSPGAQKIEGLTYVVKPGDNLSKIARKFYGDAGLDRFIARANNIANPAELSVGQKLIIPNR